MVELAENIVDLGLNFFSISFLKVGLLIEMLSHNERNYMKIFFVISK